MEPKLLLLVLPFAGCLGLFWLILKFSSGRITTQYRQLAERFGLELEQPEPRMAGFIRPEPSLYGHYRGREVSFSAPGKGLKGTRQMESVLKLELRNPTLSGQLAPSGLLGGLRQRDSGGQGRWKSGDSGFDQTVDVRTNSPERLSEALTDERRSWLAAHLKKAKATIYLGDGTIAYARLGLIADEATRGQFEDAVEFFCDLAEALES